MTARLASTDLQGFLASYQADHPEQVLHIHTPVDAKFQVTAIVAQLERQKRFPTLVFHKVLVDGVPSEFPLVVSLMASRQRLASLLATTVERAGAAVYEAMQHKLEPRQVSRVDAPVKEVVRLGEDADVTVFPALWHHDRDPGRYISAGFLTSYHPDTGIVNSAIQRGWIKGPREIPVQIGPASHNHLIASLYRERKQDLPVAYWIGHHPLVIVGCQARVSLTESHYATAGALLGEPLRVVPSETLGEDFLVPADAEVVIEGYIPWNETSPEGPFGEYTRHVGESQEDAPVIRVTAITHRRGAHWQGIMVGHSHWVSSLVMEGLLFHTVRAQFPNLLNVHLPMSGCGVHHAYLQIRKQREGQGKAVLTAALSANANIKHAFVVDEDIDVFDEKEVLLALATRFQGDRDLLVISNTQGPFLDPSGQDGVGTKVGFDCTKPLKGFAERLHIPADLSATTDLDDYIPPDVLRSVPVEVYG
jgi:2,5-furandicarboxylate decarboxylase 1